MTLIINAATQGFIVHASDRLLTKRVGGTLQPHGNPENKSLIVRTKDAICVIGYTGSAYIGDVITDEWIASTITGLDLTGSFMMRQPGVRGLSLNQLLRRLEAGLAGLVLPGSANYLGITVSGIRQRGRYIRPFVRELERNKGDVRSAGYMRYPRSPNFHLLSQIGDHGPMGDLQRTIGKEFEQFGISAEAFRLGMVNAIQDRAKLSSAVGDEIMSITITRSKDGFDVVWTFVSPQPRIGIVANAEGQPQRIFQSFFSPWVITPAGISKPSFGNGHLDHIVGNVTIRCGNENEQPGRDGGRFMAVSSQPRSPRR